MCDAFISSAYIFEYKYIHPSYAYTLVYTSIVFIYKSTILKNLRLNLYCLLIPKEELGISKK